MFGRPWVTGGGRRGGGGGGDGRGKRGGLLFRRLFLNFGRGKGDRAPGKARGRESAWSKPQHLELARWREKQGSLRKGERSCLAQPARSPAGNERSCPEDAGWTPETWAGIRSAFLKPHLRKGGRSHLRKATLKDKEGPSYKSASFAAGLSSRNGMVLKQDFGNNNYALRKDGPAPLLAIVAIRSSGRLLIFSEKLEGGGYENLLRSQPLSASLDVIANKLLWLR